MGAGTAAVGRAPAATAPAAPGGHRSGRPTILVVVTDDPPRGTERARPETVDWLGGLGTARTDDRLTAHGARRGQAADPQLGDVHRQSGQYGDVHRQDEAVHGVLQASAYSGLRLDRQGRLPGGVNGGEVLFREYYGAYYDLRGDPYQLTDRLHGARAQQERRLGVPERARRLTAARATWPDRTGPAEHPDHPRCSAATVPGASASGVYGGGGGEAEAACVQGAAPAGPAARSTPRSPGTSRAPVRHRVGESRAYQTTIEPKTTSSGQRSQGLSSPASAPTLVATPKLMP